MPLLSTTVRTLEPQPALIIRSRIARSDIAATIGGSLGRIMAYAPTAGAEIAGMPFARYPEFSEGMLTMEAGMPLRAAVAGSGDIESFTLPAGRAAVAVHQGPYDQLPQSFGAFESWMKEQGLVQNGAPWESYVTDPGQEPDSSRWITEIYWPVR